MAILEAILLRVDEQREEERKALATEVASRVGEMLEKSLP